MTPFVPSPLNINSNRSVANRFIHHTLDESRLRSSSRGRLQTISPPEAEMPGHGPMGNCATAELRAGLDTSFKQLLNQSRGPMDHSNGDGHFEAEDGASVKCSIRATRAVLFAADLHHLPHATNHGNVGT